MRHIVVDVRVDWVESHIKGKYIIFEVTKNRDILRRGTYSSHYYWFSHLDTIEFGKRWLYAYIFAYIQDSYKLPIKFITSSTNKYIIEQVEYWNRFIWEE